MNARTLIGTALLTTLSAALSAAHAQNGVNLQNIQLQPIQISNLNLNVLRVPRRSSSRSCRARTPCN